MDESPPRGQHDHILFVAICVLTAIGLVMVYSASYASASRQEMDPEGTLLRQLGAVAIGLVALLVCSCVPTESLRRLVPPAFALSLALLVLALMLPPGPEGTRRFIPLGDRITLQPSTLATVALVAMLAVLGHQYAGKEENYGAFLGLGLGTIGLTCFLIVQAPNLSTSALTALAGMVVLLLAGMRWKHLLYAAGVFGLLGALMARYTDYMAQRIEEYIGAMRGGDHGYQATHALIALGSGGWFGKGLCRGVEKFGYLPEVHNDMIFAAIGEELGLVMTLLVVALYGLVMVRGLRAALGAPTLFGRYLAAGLTTLIIAQAVLNMLVVTGGMPVTGVPLPFISAGGTSVVVLLGAAGLILSVSREYTREPREVMRGHADTAGNRRHGRARVPSPRSGRFPSRAG